jgi:adenylyltransferase/sulfurtransferase
MGLLGTTAALVGAVQVTEAMKILLGRSSELLGGPLSIDIWNGRYRKIPVPAFGPESNPCPACGTRDFPYLRGEGAARAAVMCGRRAVLITPNESALDYAGVETRLAERLSVFRGPGFVRFAADGCEFVLYSSGRALIFGTGDSVKAQALYGRYITS